VAQARDADGLRMAGTPTTFVGFQQSREDEASRRTMTTNRHDDADEALQWLLTLFLGPIAVTLAGIVIGLLLRGSGVR
jgi:type IV secretory pathway VirB2 component (pilin)